MDAVAFHRLHVFVNPWSRDSRVGSYNDRDSILHCRKACVLLFAGAVVVDRKNVRDLPKLEVFSPGSVCTYSRAAPNLLLAFDVEPAPCQRCRDGQMFKSQDRYIV